jgi:hypothetical protein
MYLSFYILLFGLFKIVLLIDMYLDVSSKDGQKFSSLSIPKPERLVEGGGDDVTGVRGELDVVHELLVT